MLRHTLLAFSIGLIIFMLYLMQYTGFFKSVTVAIDQRGPYTLIYKDYQGAYYKIVPTDRKSTRLNSSHSRASRMPSSA